ncbi:MAG: sulfur carrier protein ThiS [Beijerinckiaceae bacterium]|jgi:sulfur carrier protein
MQISINGKAREVEAGTLAALLDELDYGEAVVATALNQAFVRAADREKTELHDGDQVEILVPRQGG